jgi:hypothetical protein
MRWLRVAQTNAMQREVDDGPLPSEDAMHWRGRLRTLAPLKAYTSAYFRVDILMSNIPGT